MGKNINEFTVIELKALLFDMDQEVKAVQSQMNSVAKILQKKISEENEQQEQNEQQESKEE